MISKALYKQSCKANATMWSIITFAVCFMLACVMLISGGGSIGEVKSAIQDTIIVGEVDSNIQKMGINYFDISKMASEKFDELFYTADYQAVYQNTYTQTVAATGDTELATKNAYLACLNKFDSEFIEVTFGSKETEEGKTAYGVIMLTLSNSNYDIASANAPERSTKLDSLCRNVASDLIATNITSDETINTMVEKLAEYGVTKEKFISFGYNYDKVHEEVDSTLLSYIARINNEKEKLTNGKIDNAAYAVATEKIVSDLSDSLLSTLPDAVSDALEEVGKMDLYSLIVGSVFYKMAGLLLPIIFMIMASTSLIAGQVDSGSMAYVLSTSTERKQVTFTQAIYLISSLFAMFVCTTITSVICLAIVKTDAISITYGQIILLNVGAFITMFAMSGICFCASCWFDRSKKAMGIGGGLCMFFLVATMLGLFGSKVLPSVIRLKSLNFFNYVTLISLFDVISIISNSTTFIWKFAILIAIGAIGYAVGSIKFEKKDLPL